MVVGGDDRIAPGFVIALWYNQKTDGDDVKRSNTKKALICLLAAFGYVVALCIFLALSTLDFVLAVDILRVLVIGPMALLITCAPFVIIYLGIAGFVYEIMALRAGESKVNNIIMMVPSICFAILAVLTAITMVNAMLYG